jgi:hypothetical protein
MKEVAATKGKKCFVVIRERLDNSDGWHRASLLVLSIYQAAVGAESDSSEKNSWRWRGKALGLKVYLVLIFSCRFLLYKQLEMNSYN